MASISVNCDSTEEPTTRLLPIGDGRLFVSFQCGPDISVILPGFDAVAQDYARALANALMSVADLMDTPAAQPVTEPEAQS